MLNFWLFLAVAAVLSSSNTFAQSVDLTLMPGANGADVVRAVLSKIDASQAFDTTSDSAVNLFMRRLAFATTRDGVRTNSTYPPGGMWAVPMGIFARTQSDDNGIDSRVYDAVNSYLNIMNWKTNVMYQDLRIPLYSGMAVRLYLQYIDVQIGQNFITTLAGQLGRILFTGNSFWSDYFQPEYNVTVVDLRNAISDLADHEHCRIHADIVFVLDSSGSIRSHNFEIVKNFTIDFARELSNNTHNNVQNQIGVVLYATYATVPIRLGQYDNITDWIRTVEYTGGGTNTPEGICQMISQPWREGVLRIAIVLTDGKANRESPTCGTVQEAADRAREQSILVYAIGVGGGVNVNQLQMIASAPHFIDHVDTFTDIESAQETRSYEICFTAVQEATPGVLNAQIVGKGQESRLRYTAPQEEGITVRICVRNGRLVLYASTSVMNPNAALNDWSRTIRETNQSVKCLTNHFGEPSTRTRKRATNEDLTLYLTIEGVEASNEFSVNSSFGNVTYDTNECEQETSPCDDNADCHNTDGSFFCVCYSGYTVNGTDCKDTNECEQETSPCDDNADCHNTDGSFFCVCYSGYTGNGTDCKDYNECDDDPCPNFEVCVNTPGGFSCSVNGGQLALTVVLTVGSVIILVIVGVTVTLVCFYCKTSNKKQHKEGKHQSNAPASDHSDQNSLVAEDDDNDWGYTMTITWQDQEKEKAKEK